MKAVLAAIRREPALVSGLVSAVILAVVAFGFTLTPEQIGGIMAVVIAIMAIVVRSQVTPVVSVAAEVVKGEVVTGQAAPPAGEPAAVVTSDDGTGLDPDEHGEADVGLALVLGTFFLLAACGILAVTLLR